MKVKQAVITAAGRRQHHLPLQTLTDAEGAPRTALALFLDEIASAGIERVVLVIHPGDRELYQEAAGSRGEGLVLVDQSEPLGYGHAVWCARKAVADEPFLLMVSDHVTLSDDPERSCARQLVEIAEAEDCAVSAVQATHESLLSDFGAVGGSLEAGRKGLYLIDKVIEKPTPTEAEQTLLVPGLRMAYYLCFFGMHVLTPGVMTLLSESVARREKDPAAGSVQLSPALNELSGKERYLAAELNGRRFDLEAQYGLLFAQLAVAVSSRHRESVLQRLVEVLAEGR